MYEFVRSAEEIQEMIDEADRDHDGKVNLKDFLRIMRKRGDNPMDDLSSDDDWNKWVVLLSVNWYKYWIYIHNYNMTKHNKS